MSKFSSKADEAPVDGTTVEVRVICKATYKAYAATSPQAKQGKKGRWVVTPPAGAEQSYQDLPGEWRPLA